MRFLLAFLGLAGGLGAQVCIPSVRLQPAGSAAAVLGDTSCRLADGSLYTEFSLVLPVRGKLALDAVAMDFAPVAVVRDGAGHAVAAGGSIRAPLEAGAYRVAVRAPSKDQRGEFTVRTDFAPEPGTMCREAAPIGLNDALTARLGDSSCRTPGGTTYGAFRVTALGPGTLDISGEGGEIAPTLILRGADGRALASAEARLSYELKAGETYTIVALSQQAGGYALKTAFAPNNGEACQPLKTFTDSDEHKGTIAEGGCSITDVNSEETIYYNWYEVRIPEPGLADLRVLASGFEPALALFAPDGSVIAYDANQAAVRQQLPPGRYNVLVYSAAPKGAYTLQYTFRAGPPEICPLLTLNSGDRLTGSVSAASSCRTADGVANTYQITTAAPGTLAIAMTSGDFDTFLSLRDANGSRIVADDDGGGGTNSLLYADLPAGTYTLVAATLDAPGGYNLGYNFAPVNLAPCTNVPQLGAGYVGYLDAKSCRAANGQPADFYQFTTPSDGTVALTMSSPYLDSYLELTDPNGNVLRRDDNSWGYGDAVLVQYLPAGTYRVTARAAEASVPGLYELRAYFAAGDRPAACGWARPLAIGATFEGRLNLTSCEYADYTLADLYEISLEAGAKVEVKLASTEFYGALVLLDGQGNVIDADDGSDGSASLDENLTPGTYYIAAKSALGYSGGAYRLSIAHAQQ
ncbi:MAG: pre-peptidase C-terminal domain-containing protein [Bryobacteraceae bacterium]